MRFPSCSLLAFAPPFSGTIPNSQTFSKVTGLVFLLRVRHSLSSTSKPATGSRSFRFSLGWMTKQSHLPDADHIGGTCKGAAPTTNKQTNKQTNDQANPNNKQRTPSRNEQKPHTIKQAIKQSNKQTSKQSNKQANKQASKHTNKPTNTTHPPTQPTHPEANPPTYRILLNSPSRFRSSNFLMRMAVFCDLIQIQSSIQNLSRPRLYQETL